MHANFIVNDGTRERRRHRAADPACAADGRACTACSSSRKCGSWERHGRVEHERRRSRIRADFGRVAVLMGGTSSEREVSLDSGRNCLEALRRRGVDAHAVDGIPALLRRHRARSAATACSTSCTATAAARTASLQGLLDALRRAVHRLGRARLGAVDGQDPHQAGVAVARTADAALCASVAQRTMSTPAARWLGLPVIVKPACEGSSVGMSRVFNEADLRAGRRAGCALRRRAADGAADRRRGIHGRHSAATRRLPTIRIVPAGEYYDYHAKYVADDTQYICPGLHGTAEMEMRALALEAFRTAGCSGWGRVDVMRDRRRRELPARSEHRAGHDQPFARAEGRAGVRHRVRRTGVAHARDEPGARRRDLPEQAG